MKASGFTVNKSDIHEILFDFQRDITIWALKKGRAALFCGTGLGKTFMQTEWARLVQGWLRAQRAGRRAVRRVCAERRETRTYEPRGRRETGLRFWPDGR